MNTIQSLKELYVKLGGSLTDTYSGIAGGIPVSNYTVIPDMIKALYAIYDGDLTEVYPEISDVAVSDYSTTPKAIEALAEVATKGVTPSGTISITENGENIDIAQIKKGL